MIIGLEVRLIVRPVQFRVRDIQAKLTGRTAAAGVTSKSRLRLNHWRSLAIQVGSPPLSLRLTVRFIVRPPAGRGTQATAGQMSSDPESMMNRPQLVQGPGPRAGAGT